MSYETTTDIEVKLFLRTL